MASGLHEIMFNINCDVDDPTMNNDEARKNINDIFHINITRQTVLKLKSITIEEQLKLVQSMIT